MFPLVLFGGLQRTRNEEHQLVALVIEVGVVGVARGVEVIRAELQPAPHEIGDFQPCGLGFVFAIGATGSDRGIVEFVSGKTSAQIRADPAGPGMRPQDLMGLVDNEISQAGGFVCRAQGIEVDA